MYTMLSIFIIDLIMTGTVSRVSTRTLRLFCGQSIVRVRLQLGFCSAYGFFFFKNQIVYRQEMNSIHEYIYDNNFNKLKSNYYNTNIFPFNLYFKRIYV